MRTVLLFGNELVEVDNLTTRILEKLQKEMPEINFVHRDATENIEEFGEDLEIIDVVHGIKEPLIIEDIAKFLQVNVTSMHDFDLAYNLKLLLSIDKIKSVKIYGLPWDLGEDEAVAWIKTHLQ